ncbi:Twinfilin-1 [Elasticomyces elasticus]|nr:Twinfilin-1 [Elasticomyces elasticus]KAK3662273.1 Twinfilin-1 [Elasticomyces elasticus]KAK4924788.1 Twinfilin-1 [Elasticomyces elasticus]KAK5766806.1 Twinfilin-1 [Elasticomyces elasticus]
MQSGIPASQDLQDAFNDLVSSPSKRAVLASIQNEQIVHTNTISADNSRFQDDLQQLQSYISSTQATFVLLKVDSNAPDGYVAITLSLVRELGLERFRQQIFCTEASELTAEGWKRHEQHEALDAPLTEEESGLKGVKDAEAAESLGTQGRRGHVTGRVDVKTGEGVVEALELLKEEGCRGTVVQLKYALPEEVLTLDQSTDGVAPEDVAGIISTSEPRYTFYASPDPGAGIVFIYTCPTSSRIKERMIYSTGKSWTRTVAERDAGITIAKSLEATEPNEITADLVGGGQAAAAGGEGGANVGGEKKAAFARPKRPGRR